MRGCEYCGGPMIGRRSNAKYCTSDCADKAARGRYKKKKPKTKRASNNCMQCDKEFTYVIRTNYPSPSFCPKCRKKRFIR